MSDFVFVDTNAIVANADGHGFAVGRDAHFDRPVLSEIDGIGQQISDDANHSTRIDTSQNLHIGQIRVNRHPFGLGDAGNLVHCRFNWFA